MWSIPHGPAACIHFPPAGTELAKAQRTAHRRHHSPLLVVLEDRQFGIVGTADDSLLADGDEPDALNEGEAEPSAFAVAFGLDTASGEKEDQAMDIEEAEPAAKTADWSQLVDAPSHQLPRMQALCRDFLRVLTTASS
eukprot:evm.model.scf_232EXC.2 EVM.evm.TU.scf_232EXC.2   scf_232EXC:34861-35760(+)